MNIPELIDAHNEAIEKLNNIKYQQIAINTLKESIDGVGGQSFPDLKAEWQKALEKAEAKIVDLKVEYRCFLNSIR